MATVLIYLSDVEAGGATVWPYLKLSTSPKKGDAVFWNNVDNTGEGDIMTLHGGCPVLAGDKWIANKYIRMRGN